MTSHKQRIKAQSVKGFTLPSEYKPRSHHGYSHSRSHDQRDHAYNFNSEYAEPENSVEKEPVSPIYANEVQTDLDDSEIHTELPKPHHPSSSRHHYLNTNKTYASMNGKRPELIYKSQSLNALKAKEPSKVLMKSSIQQEYHDQLVQHYLRGITYGRAKKPCTIAVVMFVVFVLLFILGLTLICLTYIYKNISFSLDKGEALGPVILACSFIFLAIGIKFVYDAYRISQHEKRNIRYQGYDHRYVGLRNNQDRLNKTEKLASGSATKSGLTRVPVTIHNYRNSRDPQPPYSNSNLQYPNQSLQYHYSDI